MIGMRWVKLYGIIISGLVLAINLSDCNALIPQPTPTLEPIQADCFIYYHLTAWEDLNADGIQDDGESPLEGVEFRIRGPYAHSLAGGKGITDAAGYVTIDIWMPGGCLEDEDYAIDAVPPSGYAPSADLPLSVEGVNGSYDYAVGFYPDPEPPPAPEEPEEPIMADCFIYYHLTAWEDLNADGFQDDGDGPLEGVEFKVLGPYSILSNSGGGITDASGRVSFDLWGPGGCLENVEIKIDAVPPAGYAPSIDLPLSVEGVNGSHEYAIGFYPKAAE